MKTISVVSGRIGKGETKLTCKGRLRGIFNPVQRDFDETLWLQVSPVRSRFQLPIGQSCFSEV
jgi:hypothetical protein